MGGSQRAGHAVIDTIAEKEELSPAEQRAREADKAMHTARALLVADHPFFGAMALRLKLLPDSNCRDLWSDGLTMGYNPLFVASLSREKLIGAQAHEILHLACGHHVRRRNRDPKLWNKACDLTVNQMLLESGFQLPDGFVMKPEYANMGADAIYDVLVRLLEKEANEGAQAGATEGKAENQEGSAGQGKGEGQEQDQQSDANPDPEKGEEEGEGASTNAAAPSEDGEDGHPSGKDGKAHFEGEVRDHPLLDGMENDAAQKKAELEAELMLEQAAQSAKNMGGVPAGVARLLGKRLLPRLDWRELLRRFLENVAQGDYSWSYPNRRYVSQGLYLPSRREPRLPGITLVVDSSGSVDEDMLTTFCAELSSVLDAYDTELTILFHDTEVYQGPILGRADLPELEARGLTPVGGGGTDYRPVPEYMDDHDMNPTCVLWFTDLECDFFPDEPNYPVLWICPVAGGTTPPFGDLIRMTEE